MNDGNAQRAPNGAAADPGPPRTAGSAYPAGSGQQYPSGRFGAATPGIRPDRTDLENLVSQPPPGRRRIWRRLAAAAVVIAVAGAGYAAGHFITSAGSPGLVSLVVTNTDLPQGAKLSAAELTVVSVAPSAVPPGALGPAGASASIGLVTDRPVPAGTFLTRSLLVPGGEIPGPGQAQVGLALKPGQVPSGGLAAGQRVLVVLLPESAQGAPKHPVPLGSATVWSVTGSSSTGAVSVTVVVPAYLATSLAGYASRGQVALVATYAGPAPAGPSPAPTPARSTAPGGGRHRKKK